MVVMDSGKRRVLLLYSAAYKSFCMLGNMKWFSAAFCNIDNMNCDGLKTILC